MVTFVTGKPNALLAAIKAAILQKKITTWTCSNDGDFTHNPVQWNAKAWLRPSVVEGKELRFAIIRPNNANIGTETYAIYHGRFIEMMLSHFDRDIFDASATPLPAACDVIKAA